MIPIIHSLLVEQNVEDEEHGIVHSLQRSNQVPIICLSLDFAKDDDKEREEHGSIGI